MYLSLCLSTKTKGSAEEASRDRDVLGVQPLQRLVLPGLVRYPDAHLALGRVCGRAINDAAERYAQRGPHYGVCTADRKLRAGSQLEKVRRTGWRSKGRTWAPSHADSSPIFTSTLSMSRFDVSNLWVMITITIAVSGQAQAITPRKGAIKILILEHIVHRTQERRTRPCPLLPLRAP